MVGVEKITERAYCKRSGNGELLSSYTVNVSRVANIIRNHHGSCM